MFKKMIVTFILLQSVSTGSALAAFNDLELFRVYYERTTGTTELATDLGSVTTLIAGGGSTAGTLPAVTNPANLFAVYFAFDKTNNLVWVSGTPDAAQVAVGSAGFSGAKSGYTNVQSYYATTLGGGTATSVTGLQTAINSYRNKLSGTQGFLGNAVAGGAGRAGTEIKLESLVNGSAGFVSQALYHLATPNTPNSVGVEVASITTLADGSTIVGPPKTHQTLDAITLTPATLAPGGSATITVAASSGLPVTLASSTPSVCTVSGNTVTVTGTAGSTCGLTANQPGSLTTFYAAKQLNKNIIITSNQTIGAISFVPPTLSTGGSTTASATSSSGLPVTFSSLTPLVCSVSTIFDINTGLSTGTATVSGLTGGTCSVAADQIGDPVTNPAPQVTQNITVTSSQAAQAILPITFTPPNLTVGKTTTAGATASSGLPVSFNTTTGGICSVSGAVVTGLALGTCTVTADQAGDTSFAAAPQVTQNITVIDPFIKINGALVPDNTLTAALAAPLVNAVILLQSGPMFAENAVMNNPVTIQLGGGYSDPAFTVQDLYTTVTGSLTITGGTGNLQVSRIIIKQP